MPAFIFAIFLSAFLLFQVQPIIARYILPWYGGSPAVWTTCMLFFQMGLLVGYGYAHLLVASFRNRPKWQAGIHLGVILLSMLLLPITPPEALKPTGEAASPIGGIVWLLLVTVGMPYAVIAASGPLIQHWFGSVSEGKSPYRLYAVSNFGSLLGLLTYPVVFEPNLRLGQQTNLWSFGYVAYAILAGVCAWQFVRAGKALASSEGKISKRAHAPKAPWVDRLLWVSLAACGSLLLLATTNQMCQDVAVVPFLWVLPLSLYLITFIIAFDHSRWYSRSFWMPLAAISIGALVYLINQDFGDSEMHVSLQIAIYALAMFSGCMVCHGEMVRLKPHPAYLTSFYLAVSLGGALGGVFVSLVAPRIFTSYWELHLGLVVFGLLAVICVIRGVRNEGGFTMLVRLGMSAWVVGMAVMAVFLERHISEVRDGAISTMRGFYGVLRVYEGDQGTEDHYLTLYHGRISHGLQLMDEQWQLDPVTYYCEGSGPGVLFDYLKNEESSYSLNVGVVGLGIGTLAAYAGDQDAVRMYEINPQVEELARKHFTYLENCQGEAPVILGDARIVLEQELVGSGSQQYDALFVDAFSGDSIPVHLLTREAFEVYFDHLKDDGVLAVHITNLHLDLSDPVRTLANELGKEAVQIEYYPEYWWDKYSRWVFVTSNEEFLNEMKSDEWVTPWESEMKPILWTDDYSNLLQVVEW